MKMDICNFKFEMNYVDNKLHGKKWKYFKSGQLKYIMNFIDGEQHGKNRNILKVES